MIETVIKDSGNRREFTTGAVRDIAYGKGRCDLLPLDVISSVLHNDEVIMHIHKYQETNNEEDLIEALNVFVKEHHEWDNLFTMTLEVAKQFEDGCIKYGERNWQKGIPVNCYIDSSIRHYLKYMRGDVDEPHDRAFCWNIICCIWTLRHKPDTNA